MELRELVMTQLVTGCIIAAGTGLLVQFAVKPGWAAKYGDDWAKWPGWIPWATNLITGAIGIILSVLAGYILSELVNGQAWAIAVLRGVLAGALATYFYENIINYLGWQEIGGDMLDGDKVGGNKYDVQGDLNMKE